MRLAWALDQSATVLTWIIAVAGIVWLVAYPAIGLVWRRMLVRRLAAELEKITRPLPHGVDGSLSAQARTEAYLLQLREALDDPAGAGRRRALAAQLYVHDENRLERRRSFRWFAAWWHFFRNTVEAFPAAGILGTVLALAAASQAGSDMTAITAQFGGAVWSTVWGIAYGIVLLGLGSVFDTACDGLVEVQKEYRATISALKRSLPPTEIDA